MGSDLGFETQLYNTSAAKGVSYCGYPIADLRVSCHCGLHVSTANTPRVKLSIS